MEKSAQKTVDTKGGTAPSVKWYFKFPTVIMAIFCVGPFALPLLWASPAFSKKLKVIITLAFIISTVLLIRVSFKLYNILLDEMHQLQDILNS